MSSKDLFVFVNSLCRNIDIPHPCLREAENVPGNSSSMEEMTPGPAHQY